MTHLTAASIARQDNAPSNQLDLDEALSLLDKHIRWYGFADWTVAQVTHDQNGDLSAQIATGAEGVICTASINGDTGVLAYQVKNPAAFSAR